MAETRCCCYGCTVGCELKRAAGDVGGARPQAQRCPHPPCPSQRGRHRPEPAPRRPKRGGGSRSGRRAERGQAHHRLSKRSCKLGIDTCSDHLNTRQQRGKPSIAACWGATRTASISEVRGTLPNARTRKLGSRPLRLLKKKLRLLLIMFF